jgi:Rad52/22 family double-strand break repair protein
MSNPNGRANDASYRSGADKPVPPAPVPPAPASPQFAPEQVKPLVAALEVPFDPCVIEWRVTNTTKNEGPARGQVIPYADQRAYTDRLNALVSPAGWTRKYTVHTSANFQRGKDQRTVAKVLVTCEITIFGLGTHSATGEEWADDDNAGTAAEAQAFKRAACCFGLGRYLYYFTGVWVDLDQRKRPKTVPKLPKWATPSGWLEGLRPGMNGAEPKSPGENGAAKDTQPRQAGASNSAQPNATVRELESMETKLGKKIYHGLLKDLARVWSPTHIQEPAMQEKVLKHMQAAERGFQRVDAALEKVGTEPLIAVLKSLNIKTLEQVADLETLHKIVLALEAKAGLAPHRA